MHHLALVPTRGLGPLFMPPPRLHGLRPGYLRPALALLLAIAVAAAGLTAGGGARRSESADLRLDTVPGATIATVDHPEFVQRIIRIDGPSSPVSYPVAVLPVGATAEVLDGGAVEVVDDDGTVLGHYDTPWAYDMNGDPVPTRFEIAGRSIVQHVSHSDGFTYPVVADPCWSCFFASAGTAVLAGATAAAVCGFSAGVGCAIAAGAAIGATVGTYRTARSARTTPLIRSTACGAAFGFSHGAGTWWNGASWGAGALCL